MPEVLTVRLDAKSEWRLDRLAAATARGKITIRAYPQPRTAA
jgi:predicted transcriptional regulator